MTTTTHTYHPGDIVRLPDGGEHEVEGYDGASLRFARMGSMRRHESMVTLVYRPPSREEVEALRAALLQACDLIYEDLPNDVSGWRKLATEGLPE